MASQRFHVVALAGEAARFVGGLFRSWAARPDPEGVDRFCTALRANATRLPVVYACEWVDRWLMGNAMPGAVEGLRFRVACFSPADARAAADRCGSQFAEQNWLATRLREASSGWGGVAEPVAVVLIRDVFGPSTTDDEVRQAAAVVPDWLSAVETGDPRLDRV